jgi:hypothetical protein
MQLDLAAVERPINGTRFSNLRPAQREALRVYSAGACAYSDIAIELPTGAGKSLIALLILEYWRRQDRLVAILTGNKTLARQLESEAKDLQVPVVRFEGRRDELPPADLRRYRRGQAIAVMNYWVYFNQNPAVDPAHFLVLDDAQLAEASLLSLFSTRIGRREHPKLFADAMRLFAQYTDSPVADDFEKGIGEGPAGFTDLVPFASQIALLEEFEALIEAHLKDAKATDSAEWTDLRFRWQRLRPQASQALLLLNNQEILLRPYIYPSLEISHLAAPSQRIYMSATIHDVDDLQRRLGVPSVHKLPITPELAREEDGRRLFLFNQTSSVATHDEPGEEVLAPLKELLSCQHKSVWLCSATHEARRWRTWVQEQLALSGKSSPTWELTSIGDELEQFSAVPQGHLFIGGRFEGMDFPDDACRLAVFPSLPRATGALERFLSDHLKDAAFQRIRMLERVKQGIGRCTRGTEDYAVCFFLDPRFYIEMESRLFSTLQSSRTRRQIEVGLELTQDGMGAVVPFAKKFLSGDFTEFDARETAVHPPPVSSPPTRTSASSVSDEVEGWRALYGTRNFDKAAVHFERVSATLGDAEREHRGFWKYLEAHAEYLRFHLNDQRDSLAASLNHLERSIAEGGSSSWFNRLRRSKNQLLESPQTPIVENYAGLLDQWDALVERYPLFKGRFLKWQAALRAFLDGKHNQVCEALETLGRLLGYTANRPSGDGAPDGLWVAGDHAATIEVKVDIQRKFVTLSDVNQADGHRRAAVEPLNITEDRIVSVIVTPLRTIAASAEQALGSVRIIQLELVEEVQARLEQRMRAYWKGWARESAELRADLRRVASASLPPSGWFFRAVKSTRNTFLTSDDLFAEWPS